MEEQEEIDLCARYKKFIEFCDLVELPNKYRVPLWNALLKELAK